MTSNRKAGALGLLIPVINTSASQKPKMTPEGMTKWRASLPMADTGAAAKKLFIMLSELNGMDLSPTDRFEIVEQLRIPLKSICTTLKKHYIEQRKPLTERKLTIANLRQSLLNEMLDNYKTTVEQLAANASNGSKEQLILTTAICRCLYYFNSILICRYQLYSYIPEKWWFEIHLLYKYAKKNDLLKQKVKCIFSFDNETTSVLSAYAHIILLYATDPYQWRQAEQHALNKVTSFWALNPLIYEHSQIPSTKVGIYIIDLDQDFPPIGYTFKRDPITSSCIGFDLAPHVKHIKEILDKMTENQLSAKIQHQGSPEFSATKPTLNKLMKIWSMEIIRDATRFPMDSKIKIAFGLIAAHYYINNQKEFDSHPITLDRPDEKDKSAGPGLAIANDLPTFEVTDDEEEDEDSETVLSALNQAKEAVAGDKNVYDPEKEEHYHLYDYSIDDMSPGGVCVSIKDGTFPPFHAGEIVVFKNVMNDDKQWSIGAVRWLRRKDDLLFQIGIQLISPYAKAGGMQMIRDGKPIGHLLRCLVLPPMPDLKLPQMVITATPPFHSNKVILVIDNEAGVETTLDNEVGSTDMYYQYAYTTKEVIEVKDPKEEGPKPEDPDNDKTNTEFDEIWKDL